MSDPSAVAIPATRVQRFLGSPTWMTLVNTTARVVSLTVVLPLVLRTFAPADIALYHLFASIIALQLMLGSGFVPTFARYFSQVLAGAGESQLRRAVAPAAESAGSPVDPVLLSRLMGTLQRVFLALAVLSVPLLATVGTLLLRTPVAASANSADAWAAWTVIVLVTPFTLYANRYSALLQGANRIALEQKWSALFVILGAISGAVVLLAGGGLFELVLANQAWQLASVVRLAWLTRVTLQVLPYVKERVEYSSAILALVWPAAWRSFVGAATSISIAAATGLAFAQRMESVRLAEFLFGLRVMAIAAEMSRAPFYSKLPILNALRVRGSSGELPAVALKAMRTATLFFTGLFLAAPLGAAVLLPLIGSQIAFPSFTFWSILGFATLLERWGAMHLQLYSTTNHIIWHWLNGSTGVLWIGLMVVLFPRVGAYSYPLAMLLAYGAIYSQISARRSIFSIGMKFWSFERRNGGVALAAFGAAAVILVSFELLLKPALP